MARLVLVLDAESGLAVCYDFIPGNVLGINTIMNVVNDVADSPGIVIDSLVLDAGYVSKELVGAFHFGTEKTLIGREKYSFVRKHQCIWATAKRSPCLARKSMLMFT